MAPSHQFDITIPNNTTAGQEVQERIIQMMRDREFSDRDLFGVRLALEEALVNAIKHGNKMDESKSVLIECEFSENHVRIEIEDQGPGFDLGDVPDPTLEENLEKPSGRGIMLMRSFMNSIEYVGNGNRVVLEKSKTT